MTHPTSQPDHNSADHKGQRALEKPELEEKKGPTTDPVKELDPKVHQEKDLEK